MEQDQDETVVVSRTTPFVEEATVITSSIKSVEEETVTNPTFTNPDHTSTGPNTFGLVTESEPAGPIPELQSQLTNPISADVEATFEREIGEVYEAPSLVPTKAIPLPNVVLGNRFEIAPEVVEKSRPTSDAAKLFKKNVNRTRRNSLGVILVVVAGALLIGVTLALLWAKFVGK